MSKHVKLLLENVQKPSCTPLGNPAEAETRRGNFDIKLRLSEKREESSSFMEGRKSNTNCIHWLEAESGRVVSIVSRLPSFFDNNAKLHKKYRTGSWT